MKATIRIASALVVASAAFAELAAQQPSAAPAPGTPKDFKLAPRTSFTLPNGMTVSMVRFGSLPKVYVRLNVGAGAVNEAANETWISRLTADMLQEGTTTRTAQDIARDVASMGGALSVYAAPDRTLFFADVLSERGPDFVKLVADVVRNPRFPESEFARIKANAARDLAIQKTQPQAVAQERFAAMMYPGHPYGRLYPSDSLLAGYTLDQIRGFHAANYGAARATLYISGVFDAAAMERAVRDAFTGWAAGSPPANVPAPSAPTTRDVVLLDRPNAVQSTIYLGTRTPGPADSDYVRLVVSNALLGGSFGSRITSNIREDKGYTYSPFSFLSDDQRGSYWAEVADVTTPVTGASLTEIFKEIDRLQKEAPAAAELKGIQNYLAGVFVIQNSSRQGVGDQLSWVDLFGVGDSYLRDYVRKVLAVTPEEVRATTAKYVRPERMSLVVVGDRKTVAPQLAPWGTIAP